MGKKGAFRFYLPGIMETDRSAIIEQNVLAVRERIARACERAGRDPAEVTLVAVTKSVEPEVAELLLDAGVGDIGENRVAEAERKRALLGGRGVWHMVGHLQRKKVKKALPLFSVIHSVDTIRLIEEISRRHDPSGRPVEVFLEVNVSGEASKYGFAPQEVFEAARSACELPGLALRGLMTMAPYDPDPEASRPVFRQLRELLEALRGRLEPGAECGFLSMGMSGDFETAVEEGATHVRIGTALFEGLDRC
jgi:pyridoxal phosphate enzyme (YggS family)